MTDQEIVELFKALSTDNKYCAESFVGAEFSRADLLRFAGELLSRVIPDGCVVVPKEPTMEMCAAGWHTHITPCAPDIIYRAMIAAAPANKEW